MKRTEAWVLLTKYNQDHFHLQHALTVEAVMRWYAEKLGYGGEADFWATVGLLHDLDFEQLTGLIWAAALMRPSKSTKDMELKSLKKKYKDKKFAAGCSREIIQRGADQLGWKLDTLLERTLEAMRDTEDTVAAEMAKL